MPDGVTIHSPGGVAGVVGTAPTGGAAALSPVALLSLVFALFSAVQAARITTTASVNGEIVSTPWSSRVEMVRPVARTVPDIVSIDLTLPDRRLGVSQG